MYRSTPRVIAIKTGYKLRETAFIKTVTHHSDPWRHWIANDFFDTDTLIEIKSIPHTNIQRTAGRRVGSDRLFINDACQHAYPNLWRTWCDLKAGGILNQWFSDQTGLDYSDLFPRLEIISDFGPFVLEPHHDHLEKRLTAMIYTDHERLWPGTMLSDGSRVDSRDNLCFFFVPSTETVHSYPFTTFDQVRRCVQINYWTYLA